MAIAMCWWSWIGQSKFRATAEKYLCFVPDMILDTILITSCSKFTK